MATRTSVDGSPISAADLDRLRAEEALFAQRQRRTALVVASVAHDRDDARMLFDMLGIGPQVLADARREVGGARPDSAA